MPPPHHDHHHEHGHHHDHHHHKHHDDHVKPHEWHRIQEETDFWWDELPPHKKKAAETLGYHAQLWDKDEESALGEKEWSELTSEQQMAAAVFGYAEKTWNAEEDHHHGPPHHKHDHHHDHHHHHPHEDHHSPAKKEEEEKKDNEDEETADDPDIDLTNLNVNDVNEAYVAEESTTNDDNNKKQQNNNNKPLFKISKSFGGQGGGPFDHGNNRHIRKITVYADSHVVYGLELAYANKTMTAGSTTSGKAQSLELAKDEFVVSITVRSNALVQCLTFQTNKGNVLGPCGGKGWARILRKDTEGEEVVVKAPFKFQLCGIMGRSGSMMDQIAFRWGVIPK